MGATQAKSPAPQYLTQTQKAAQLGVTARTLSNWHRTGKLRGWRPGGATHGKLFYPVNTGGANGKQRKPAEVSGNDRKQVI